MGVREVVIRFGVENAKAALKAAEDAYRTAKAAAKELDKPLRKPAEAKARDDFKAAKREIEAEQKASNLDAYRQRLRSDLIAGKRLAKVNTDRFDRFLGTANALRTCA